MIDAARIRLRRLELRMSQEDLGKQLGQDQAYVSRLERGLIADITVGTFERLAKALQVKLEVLLKPETNRESEQLPTAVA
jgi:transcriptional regulator with XRE-family HTH domain